MNDTDKKTIAASVRRIMDLAPNNSDIGVECATIITLVAGGKDAAAALFAETIPPAQEYE